jgi:hypothetical protein
VVGDNNCFFNALCVCSAIKDEDPWELWTSLADFIEDSMEARRVYTEILHGSIPFDSFVKRLRTNGTWQGTKVAVFMCMICSLNIVIVSNSQAGIFSDNIRLWENIDFIEEDAPTIYLYYHLHKKPFTPSSILNHYGYLFAYDGSNPKGFNIYRNSRNDTSEPSTVDLSRDGATKINDYLSKDKDDESQPPQKRCKKLEQNENVIPPNTPMVDLNSKNDDTDHPPPKCSKQTKRNKADEKQKRCDALKKTKDRKQSVLTKFLTRMEIDKEVVQKLEKRKGSAMEYAELEIFRVVQCVMLSLVQRIQNAGTAGFKKPQLIREPVRVHST